MAPFPCPCCDLARSLCARLAEDDVDGAIDAGLMAFRPCGCADGDAAAVAAVLRAQARLCTAWDARRRYRLRQARLARRAAEREARRLAAAPAPASVADGEASVPPRPALPAGAAAILARAKAKAAERMKR